MSGFQRSGLPGQGNVEDDNDTIDSMSTFGMGEVDARQRVVLKDWSAQDFANIYVRFRPHLIRHAGRFLREQSQAEEVVQDAFLYLMTALPELDSELGVLRFLKWKTKMLCLDRLRTASERQSAPLTGLEEELVDYTQVSSALERADDAAVIQLALSRLNERQREALIATAYEGKAASEVASQMGLSNDAFRQLLFRSRAAFKRALVGEAEIKGKSVPEILTVAARRANSLRGAALVGLLIFSAAAIPSFRGIFELEAASKVFETTTIPSSQIAESQVGSGEQINPNSVIEVQKEDELGSIDVPAHDQEGSFVGLFQENPLPKSQEEIYNPGESIASDQSPSEASAEMLRDSLGQGFVSELSASPLKVSVDNNKIVASNNYGLRAHFYVSPESESKIQFLTIEYSTDDVTLKAVPLRTLLVSEIQESQTYVSFAATDFLVGDFSGAFNYASTDSSLFSSSAIKIDLHFNEQGDVVESSINFIPRDGQLYTNSS